MQHFASFFLEFQSNLLVEKAFILLNAAFAMTVFNLISRVRLISFVVILPKYSKYFTFSG